jgi:hypothetical protein
MHRAKPTPDDFLNHLTESGEISLEDIDQLVQECQQCYDQYSYLNRYSDGLLDKADEVFYIKYGRYPNKPDDFGSTHRQICENLSSDPSCYDYVTEHSLRVEWERQAHISEVCRKQDMFADPEKVYTRTVRQTIGMWVVALIIATAAIGLHMLETLAEQQKPLLRVGAIIYGILGAAYVVALLVRPRGKVVGYRCPRCGEKYGEYMSEWKCTRCGIKFKKPV